MARNLVCSICANEARRRAVDDALLAGKGVRQIQAELGIPKSTVHNHKTRVSDRSCPRRQARPGAAEMISSKNWTACSKKLSMSRSARRRTATTHCCSKL